MKQRDGVKDLEGYRVIKEHSEDCYIVGTKQIFYLLEGAYWGNHVGNVSKKRSNYHKWYRVVCNDPCCDYKGIIDEKLISEFIVKLDIL